MKHKKNFLTRIIFFTVIYITYYKLFHLFHRIDNLAFYSMFLIMVLIYYLVGYLDFSNGKITKKDVIGSIIINFVLGGINYVFTGSKKEFTVFIVLIIVANFVKYLLASLNREKQKILLVGENDLTNRIKQKIIKSNGYVYIKMFDKKNIESIKKIVLEKKINTVIVTEKSILQCYPNLLLELKMKGIKIQTYWQYNEEIEGKIDVRKIDEKWLIYSLGFNILHNNIQRRAKRLFDVIVAVIISIPAFPLMILTIILLKVIGLINKKEAGPIFFSQIRIGLGNEPFKMYKLRSMITKEHWRDVGFNPKKESWTIICDPRITKLGNFLRKTRLDELPQLLNIFRGDMSIVGPRPESTVYVEELKKKLPFYELRHSVQPGLTGWAQVMYPYGATIEDSLKKLEFDLYYIKHQNFVLDVGIFFKTVKTVLFGRGR